MDKLRALGSTLRPFLQYTWIVIASILLFIELALGWTGSAPVFLMVVITVTITVMFAAAFVLLHHAAIAAFTYLQSQYYASLRERKEQLQREKEVEQALKDQEFIRELNALMRDK